VLLLRRPQMTPTYGSKRVVVGAHYGLRDWLSQRITAALMALFTLILMIQVLLPSYARDSDGERIRDAAGNLQQVSGYDKWAGIAAAVACGAQSRSAQQGLPDPLAHRRGARRHRRIARHHERGQLALPLLRHGQGFRLAR